MQVRDCLRLGSPRSRNQNKSSRASSLLERVIPQNMDEERGGEIRQKRQPVKSHQGNYPHGQLGLTATGDLWGDIHLRVNPFEGEGAGVFLYQLS